VLRNFLHFIFALAVIPLAACQKPEVEQKDYTLDCLWETHATGSYKSSFEKIGTNGLLVFLPAKGGTTEGALLMNICNEQHHVKAGTLPGPRQYAGGKE